MGFSESDSFDDVLDRIHTTDPELGGGLTNHAPMAIEACVALGQPELVVLFMKRYDAEMRIKTRLAPALANPDLISIIERVDLDALDLDVALTELCAAAARAFVDDGGKSISLLHAITGPAALRLMWHWLDDANKRLGLGYAFQVAAVVISAQAARKIPISVDAPSTTLEEVRVQTSKRERDPHSIKLAEAVVREYSLDPRGEFLRAAELWP